MGDKPNFLFPMTGQQRLEWLCFYGRPVAKTPNMVSIATWVILFNGFQAIALASLFPRCRRRTVFRDLDRPAARAACAAVRFHDRGCRDVMASSQLEQESI